MLQKVEGNIDKFGTVGLFVIAIFSPCCFPLFAFAASTLGLGSFELFGGWTMWVFQAMVVISLGGLYLSYRKHRCMYPLLVAIPSGLTIFYGYHFNDSDYWVYFLYVGMIGLLIATIWNIKRNRMHRVKIELNSTITCPNCGYKKDEIMPENACAYFYECESCHTVLRPLEGDCCVYCSYGTVKCPPIQAGEDCC